MDVYGAEVTFLIPMGEIDFCLSFVYYYFVLYC